MTVVAMGVTIVLNLLDEVLEGEGVGSLDGEAETAGPDLGGHDTEGAGDAKEHGVIVELVKAVVHEECAGAGINVGPGVGNLTGSFEDVGDDSVASLYEVNEVVVLDVLLSEVDLAHEAGVGLSEDGVSVSGNNLAAGKGVLDVLSDVILGPGLAELIL